jgi:hypothetical protein
MDVATYILCTDSLPRPQECESTMSLFKPDDEKCNRDKERQSGTSPAPDQDAQTPFCDRLWRRNQMLTNPILEIPIYPQNNKIDNFAIQSSQANTCYWDRVVIINDEPCEELIKRLSHTGKPVFWV